MTYGNTGAINSLAKNLTGASDRFFDLGGINSMIRNLAEKLEKAMAELDGAMSDRDLAVSLEKMVLDSLTGRETDPLSPEVRFSLPETGNSVQRGSIIEANAMVLDLSMDFQGVTEWQGQVSVTEFHLDLHIEQIEISATSWSGAAMDGLTQLDPRTIDTGRYLIGFRDMTTLTIHDKQTRLSTTVWGDPHVDLSDEEGSSNGEFSDLTKSDTITTFHLLDGTDVVINAPDTGAIEFVDIYKNNAHARGYGLGLIHQAMAGLPERGGLAGGTFMAGGFFAGLDRNPTGLASALASGDMVRAGGDGHDWYDKSGRRVWGGEAQ
jgi:hypothetical protein